MGRLGQSTTVCCLALTEHENMPDASRSNRSSPHQVQRIRVAIMSLDETLCAVGTGDRVAFRQLFDGFGSVAMGIALRILREREAAEDAVQEAFVRLWRLADRFDPARGNARAWMSVIARNAALDQMRMRRPLANIDDVDEFSFATQQPDPPDNRLRQCLERLPAEQASAIMTMYNFGMSHSELAEHISQPLGTVKSWIRRGTHTLRLCMGGDDSDGGHCELSPITINSDYHHTDKVN